MGAMSTGDERLDAVGETIEQAKKAADEVSDQEDLDLRHRERPDPTADHGAGEDIDAAGDDEGKAREEKPEDQVGEDTPADDEIADEKPADDA
jgi:hypothetical protein